MIGTNFFLFKWNIHMNNLFNYYKNSRFNGKAFNVIISVLIFFEGVLYITYTCYICEIKNLFQLAFGCSNFGNITIIK